MTRPDLQVVGHALEACHGLELLAGAHFLGALVAGRLFQQVGPAHIAHEEKVAREDADRAAGCLVSVIWKAMCSGVWPGVWSTSTLMLPTIQLSPSRTRMTFGSSA